MVKVGHAGIANSDAKETWSELYKIAENVLPFRRADLDNGKLSLHHPKNSSYLTKECRFRGVFVAGLG
jgi:hypothetical protein